MTSSLLPELWNIIVAEVRTTGSVKDRVAVRCVCQEWHRQDASFIAPKWVMRLVTNIKRADPIGARLSIKVILDVVEALAERHPKVYSTFDAYCDPFYLPAYDEYRIWWGWCDAIFAYELELHIRATVPDTGSVVCTQHFPHVYHYAFTRTLTDRDPTEPTCTELDDYGESIDPVSVCTFIVENTATYEPQPAREADCLSDSM